jgi:hypothetical protein
MVADDTFVVGYDPGFGNTKVYVAGKAAVLQTAAARPKEVGLAAIGLKAAGRHVPIVEFGGQRFAVGPGAWHRGEPLTSLDYQALAAPERQALFYAALNKVLPAESSTITLVVGLPVPLLQDHAQAAVILESLKRLKGEHHFVISGASQHITIARIKVVAQPVGSYVDWLYGVELQPRTGSQNAEVAVIDIGFNTLDLFVIAGGQVVERHIGGAEIGVARLLSLLAGSSRDLNELDADLRTGVLRLDDRDLDLWLGEILAVIKRSWSSLKRFQAVIPSGGGAVVLGDRLKSVLATKGAAIYWPDDPIITNVRGFWKYGMKHVSAR